MAKRGEECKKASYKSKDAYSFYKEHNKQSKLSYKEYRTIMDLFYLNLREELYKGFIIKFPANLGFMGITKKKTQIVFTESGEVDTDYTTMPVDWVTTKKLWDSNPKAKELKKVVYHENFHTNGYKFGIKWSRFGSSVTNLKYYYFKPVRSFSRNLTKHINNNINELNYDNF